MPFLLAPFLTQQAAPANPNAAAANLTSAAQGWMADTREKNRLAEQQNEFGQKMGLEWAQEGRYAKSDEYERSKTKAALIGQYNEKIRQGDYAGAAAMAPQMQALGIVPKLHPPGTPETPGDNGTKFVNPDGTPFDEEQSQEKVESDKRLLDIGAFDPENAPPPGATAPSMPQPEPGPAPAVKPKRKQPQSAIPPLLGKYMTEHPGPAETPATEVPAATTPGPATSAPVAPTGTPPAAPVATTEPDLPVYEFIDQETGKSYGIIDPNKGRAQNRAEAKRRGEAFIETVPEGEAKRAAKGATSSAETPGEQKDAIANALSIIEQAMRADAMKKHGGGGGGIGYKQTHAISTDARQWTQAAATDQKVGELNKGLNSVNSTIAQLSEGTPLGEREAVASAVKAAFPGAVSDQERNFIMGGTGAWDRMTSALNQWVKGGHLAPGLIEQLRGVATRMQKVLSDRLYEVALQQAESWAASPEAQALTPEQREATVVQIMSTISAEAGRRRKAEKSGGAKKPSVLQ